MPKGTKVHRMAEHIEESEKAQGKSAEDAKRIGIATAQKITGKSYATGKTPKGVKKGK